jgi:exodeoxyribonuclease V gamma subunit
MLKIYHSNRLEILFDSLAAVVDQPVPSLLTPETIIVQSQGMARWLSLEMARRQDVCANLECPFPAAFIWRLYRAMDATLSDTSAYEIGPLVWALLGRLPALLLEPGFEPLRDYLAAEAIPGHRYYQLACRIAQTFDQYVAYRPDWVRDWEAGRESHWQAKLWRQLRKEFGGKHRADLLFELLVELDHTVIRQAGIPERISLFGIPALPLTQFEVFARLAEFIDIHFFLLNPCQAYWDEIVSKRDLARISIRDISSLESGMEMHFDPGNSLLASFGKQGRDFQRILHQYDYEEILHFDEPENRHLLAAIQADILHGRERGFEEDTRAIDPADASIQIHVAHSPMREVEILGDRLLDLFDKRPEIGPGDVLVMMPDIALYAPYIEAVFSCPEDENVRIPFSIADRSPGDNSLVIKAYLDLLKVAGGRLTVAEVLGLLEYEPIRNRFRLTREDLKTVQGWVADTAICWGIDPHHRAQLGLPPTKQGTWQNGKERLLLGYALPGGNSKFFHDILPYDNVEGSSGELLGQFAFFLDALSALAAELKRPRPMLQWTARLFGALDQFFASSEEFETDMQLIRSALDDLDREAELINYNDPVLIELVVAHLQSAFARQSRPGNFLTGQVTFCQMVPMRSIPFKVICLLGMDDGAFPRLDRPPGFDLMGRQYRIGDRLRRDDDRYLYLEALLSARDFLYISYVGAGIRDNKLLPPSPLVDELLEYIRQAGHLDSKAANTRFVTFHPLQPFSRRYFGGNENLFTYSRTNQIIAAAASSARDRGGFFPVPPLEGGSEEQEVELADFIRFFTHPARYLLQKRFGLYLDDNPDVIVEREKFGFNRLEEYQLASRLIEGEMAGEQSQDLMPVYRAQGVLPVGEYGAMAYGKQAVEARNFSARLTNSMGAAVPEPLEVDLLLGGVHLTGWLEVGRQGLYLFRFTKCDRLNYNDTIRHWLGHLLLNAITDDACMRRSVYVCRDGSVEYGPLTNAGEQLNALAELYRRGLTQPLPLFPRTSYEYALQLWKKKGSRARTLSPEEALKRAARKWHDREFWTELEAEKMDPYFSLAFGDKDPLQGKDFHEAAATLLRQAIAERRVVLDG